METQVRFYIRVRIQTKVFFYTRDKMQSHVRIYIRDLKVDPGYVLHFIFMSKKQIHLLLYIRAKIRPRSKSRPRFVLHYRQKVLPSPVLNQNLKSIPTSCFALDLKCRPRTGFRLEFEKQTSFLFYARIQKVDLRPKITFESKNRTSYFLHWSQKSRTRTEFKLESKRQTRVLLYTRAKKQTGPVLYQSLKS